MNYSLPNRYPYTPEVTPAVISPYLAEINHVPAEVNITEEIIMQWAAFDLVAFSDMVRKNLRVGVVGSIVGVPYQSSVTGKVK